MDNRQNVFKCPVCHTTGEMPEVNGAYQCRACNQVFSAAQLGDQSSANQRAQYVSEAIRSIEAPEAALLYLENFFEDFDWEDYDLSADLYIEDLCVMAEKSKVKNAGNPNAWQLAAETLVTPLQHKLAALEDLQKTIFENYRGDLEDVADEMATYNAVASALISERDAVVAALKRDLANMERFGAETEAVAAMREKAEAMEAALAEIVASTEVEDLPLVKKLAAENEAELIRTYSAKGINAVECYENGLRAYEMGRYNDGVAYMAQIKDFRDAAKYIRKMTTVFSFGEVVEVGGKFFKVAAHKAIISMENIKGGKKKREEAEAKAKAEAEAEEALGMKDLYEVVDGVIAEKPSITCVCEIVRTFGDYIYYIKNDTDLCAYNVTSKNETPLDKSKYGYDLSDSDSFGVIFSGNVMYIKKLLDIPAFENKGCFSFFNRKKKEEEYKKSVQNNFSMMTIDLAHATTSLAIEKMVGCVCAGDFVFFTVSEVVSEDKKKGKTYKNIAKMCDLSTGVTEILFEKNCQILGVSGSKVVYDFWTPNSLNRQLRVIDHITREDLVLEDNIYSFVDIAGEKVYYRVGNKNYSPLVSINLDGSERTEIIANYGANKIDLYCGWIYSWRDSVVIKTSKDGSERFILAYDAGNIVERTGSYVYYIDNTEEKGFRIVSADGSTNVRIGTGIAANDIIVASNAVYYLRKEWIGDRWGKSLYSMDLDGRNVKKMLFNISSMKKKPNSDELYVLVKDIKTYCIEVKKDKWEEDFPIDTYYKLNLKTGEMKELLVLGIPSAENYNRERKGCLSIFGKKKIDNAVITEVIPEIDYGQITQEGGEALGAIAAFNAAAQANDAKATAEATTGEKKKKGPVGVILGIIGGIILLPVTIIRFFTKK